MEGIPRIRLPSSNDPKGLWKGYPRLGYLPRTTRKGYEGDTQDKVSFLERLERVMEGRLKIRLPSSNNLKGLWRGYPG